MPLFARRKPRVDRRIRGGEFGHGLGVGHETVSHAAIVPFRVAKMKLAALPFGNLKSVVPLLTVPVGTP